MTDLLPPSPEFLVLADLFSTGHPVRLEGDKLMVKDASTLTTGQRAAIKEFREDLVRLMTPAWPVTGVDTKEVDVPPSAHQGTLPFDTQQKGQ